jgi:protoporphyrinogen oxidase
MGGKLIKEAKVIRIETKDNRILSVLTEGPAGTKRIEGDIFISSMPIKDLIEGMDAPIPDSVREVASQLPYRDFVTIGLLLSKLAKTNETANTTLNNIIPDCWIYVQDTKVRLGRIQIFNNWSPYMVQNPEKNIWVGLEYFCQENDAFWNLSDAEAIELATDELMKIGMISDRSVVLDGHRVRIQKAYPAYFDSYSRIDEVITYLNRFDNLYCIGRNGQHRYNNMDHSMVTAFETVNHIRGLRTDKAAIWKVNTEKSYHEEKTTDGKKAV